MAEIGRWNGHRFEVSPSVVRSFTGLQIKGSSETEDKKKNKQKYVKRKNGKPAEVSFTISLNAALGCDVRSEAIAFITEAEAGKKDYFYVGNYKLLTCKLMLVDASIKEIDIANGTTWNSADVQITMKQCSKFGATSGGGGGGSGKKKKKKSVKKSGKKTSKKKYGIKSQKVTPKYQDAGTSRHKSRSSEVDAVSGAHFSAKQAVSSANSSIKKYTSISKQNKINAKKKKLR